MTATRSAKILTPVFSFFSSLCVNWISTAGVIITSVSGWALVVSYILLSLELFGTAYVTTMALLTISAFFVFGLVLIPVGFLWEKIRNKTDAKAHPLQTAFKAAFADDRVKFTAVIFALVTLANVLIIAIVGTEAVQFMDSNQFCGMQCHSVMEPEYKAYLRSPHAHVHCVACHIGPGASWEVKAKISGLRQVWAVWTDAFSKPIPTPVKALRPARDTCEQCHWPAKFHGQQIAFFQHFKDDEQNTPQITALSLKVGGRDPGAGTYRGIHWHVSPEVKITYDALDESRDKIGKVSVSQPGEIKTFQNPDTADAKVVEQRIMDCVDCHNRPTHIYDSGPVQAVDKAFADGRLSQKIPFLHKTAVSLLSRKDIDREHALEFFQPKISEAYQSEHAEVNLSAEDAKSAASVLANLYTINVYPRLGITWGTYYSHLGHGGNDEDTRGCFRCHDDEHTSAAGEVISKDCDLCHEMIQEESSPEALSPMLKSILSSAE
jgi:nitrate/TMAO reductase-like tetraheme cytochrome c subunit